MFVNLRHYNVAVKVLLHPGDGGDPTLGGGTVGAGGWYIYTYALHHLLLFAGCAFADV